MPFYNVTCMILVTLIFCTILNGLQVNGYKVETEKHPDHPNECWDKETNSFYQTGSLNQRKGKCEMIRCYADYSMDAVGCHTKPVQTSCTVSKTDFSKSYPDCCPRINCSNNINNSGPNTANGMTQNGNTQTTSTQAPLAAQPASITKKPTTTIHLPVTQKPVAGTKS